MAKNTLPLHEKLGLIISSFTNISNSSPSLIVNELAKSIGIDRKNSVPNRIILFSKIILFEFSKIAVPKLSDT